MHTLNYERLAVKITVLYGAKMNILDVLIGQKSEKVTKKPIVP
jgi:hypothetical protein